MEAVDCRALRPRPPCRAITQAAPPHRLGVALSLLTLSLGEEAQTLTTLFSVKPSACDLLCKRRSQTLRISRYLGGMATHHVESERTRAAALLERLL